MPGRRYSAGSRYRYGFNGKENDNDVKGEGNQQDYGMRIYDPRLGRFLSVDPITKEYPELTPYQFASNTVIVAVDLDGLECAVKMPDGSFFIPQPGSDRLGLKYPQGGKIAATPIKGDDDGASLALDLTPIIGQGKAIWEAISGRDMITDRKLSTSERWLGIIPFAGKSKKVSKVLEATKKVSKTEQKVVKAAAVAQRAKEKIPNKEKGDQREVKEEAILTQQYPNGEVQNERYLRNDKGEIVKDRETREGRRIDHVVIENKKVVDAVETTSKTADKTKQMDKEKRIREQGGTYVRDKKTKELYDVKDVPTRISRHD